MDYEKKYKEALEVAKKLYQDCPNGKNDRLYHTTDLEKMFPELKESEDERISKEIIKYLERTVPHNHRDEVLKSKEWTAWLEKHGKSDKIVEKAKTEKQRVLVTESDGSANIYWDTRSLKDAITLLKHGLNYLQEIEVKKTDNAK